MAAKLEQEWLGSKQEVRVDNERFIDVKYMLQRSYPYPHSFYNTHLLRRAHMMHQ
jgi:hypothetical protein